MEVSSREFETQSTTLAQGIIEMLQTTHGVLGIALVMIIAVQVLIVLCTLYMRPIRTVAQFIKFVLILFAALAVCSITVGLLWMLNTA